MNNHLKTRLYFAVALAIAVSCQPGSQEGQNIATKNRDSIANPSTVQVDRGYADINGLKMYYEVHGEGKPIVLLHGSFMNIPMNWAHIIPLLATDRKVIVPEMQGHGRTRDISRELSYESMADDVSGLLEHLNLDSALAILPGTSHIGMMQRTDWLIPMITDFLDSDLDSTPPTF